MGRRSENEAEAPATHRRPGRLSGRQKVGASRNARSPTRPKVEEDRRRGKLTLNRCAQRRRQCPWAVPVAFERRQE